MPSAKSTRRSVKNSFYGSRPRFTSASTRAAHALTRKNSRGTSNPAVHAALKKAFAIVKSAKSAKPAKVIAPRESRSSLRRAALTEKAKQKEELLKARAILEAEQKVAKAKAAKARKELREAKAAAEKAAAEEKLRAAERAEQDFKNSLDEISDILGRLSIGTRRNRNGNPWQRRSLSPIREGGRR